MFYWIEAKGVCMKAEKLNRYRVRVVTKGGSVHIWERFGTALESALEHAKRAAIAEFGEIKSIAICGDQTGNGDYCF